jgi:hypothetical protein
MQADRDVLLAIVNSDNLFYMEYIPVELKTKELMMIAVKNKGYALQFAPPTLRGDKELVMAALQESSDAFQWASPELRGDKEFVIDTIQKTDIPLYHASTELCADKEVVMEAVKKNPFSVQFASPELQRDKDVIRTALRREYADGYKNIQFIPQVGDNVTLVTREPQSNPVVHIVRVILPDGRVQLNNNTISTIYARFLNFVPPWMVIMDKPLGLRLQDRTFTIKGGKHRSRKSRKRL